ncbi:MAG: helix-turn-helix domain-containing protein [Bacteroidales bacterium]
MRKRQEDIPLIADYYLNIYARRYRKEVYEINPSAYEKLTEYHWPGNIRELRHIVERAVILSEGERLKPSDFPLKQSYQPKFAASSFDSIEREAIQRALENNYHNHTKTASELGIGRSTLYRKIKKYGI